MNKKTIFLVLAIMFAVLSFCGIGYIFYTGGKANAGFACVPMVFELIFAGAYRRVRKE